MTLPWQRRKLAIVPPAPANYVRPVKSLPPPVVYKPTTTGIYMESSDLVLPVRAPSAPAVEPPKPTGHTGIHMESCMPTPPPVPSIIFIPPQRPLPYPPSTPRHISDLIPASPKAKPKASTPKAPTPKAEEPTPGSRAARVKQFISSHFRK